MTSAPAVRQQDDSQSSARFRSQSEVVSGTLGAASEFLCDCENDPSMVGSSGRTFDRLAHCCHHRQATCQIFKREKVSYNRNNFCNLPSITEPFMLSTARAHHQAYAQSHLAYEMESGKQRVLTLR